MSSNSLNIGSDGLQIFNETNGVFTPIELTTKGDILTHTGSAYSRLAVGANDLILTADSSESTGLKYAAASGGGSFVLLSTQTASNSTSVDFTSLTDNSTYFAYKFVYRDITSTGFDNYLFLRFSIDNGSSYISTSTYSNAIQSRGYSSFLGNTDSPIGATGLTAIRIGQTFTTNAGNGASGEILFYPSTNVSSYGYHFAQFSYNNYNNSTFNGRNMAYGHGFNTTTSDVDAFRFLLDTNNISTGEISMYGIKRA